MKLPEATLGRFETPVAVCFERSFGYWELLEHGFDTPGRLIGCAGEWHSCCFALEMFQRPRLFLAAVSATMNTAYLAPTFTLWLVVSGGRSALHVKCRSRRLEWDTHPLAQDRCYALPVRRPLLPMYPKQAHVELGRVASSVVYASCNSWFRLLRPLSEEKVEGDQNARPEVTLQANPDGNC